MNRREARKLAMTIIYSADFNTISIENAAKMILENEDPAIDYFLGCVKDDLPKIDEIITNSLTNYSIGRLNLVDKAIVRLATGEMLKGDTEKKIIINEALELTKEYSDQGDHRAVSFNNRLLDSISKNI